MQEVTYDKVVSEIKTLNLTDQLRLLEQMAPIIRKNTNTGHTRSILELKGKGKELEEEYRDNLLNSKLMTPGVIIDELIR